MSNFEGQESGPFQRLSLFTTVATDRDMARVAEITRRANTNPVGSEWGLKMLLRGDTIYEYWRRSRDGSIALMRHIGDETEQLDIRETILTSDNSSQDSPGLTVITWHPSLSQTGKFKAYKFRFDTEEPKHNDWAAGNIKAVVNRSSDKFLDDFLRGIRIDTETNRLKRAASLVVEKLVRFRG